MYARLLFICSVMTAPLYSMESNPQPTASPYITIYAPSGTPVGHQSKLTEYTKNGIIHGRSWSFNFPDTSQDPQKEKIKKEQTFGQGKEIQTLADMITMSPNASNRYILFGTSRGAAAILNLMKNLDAHNIPAYQIKALILEGTYAHVKQIIEYFFEDPSKHDPYHELSNNKTFTRTLSLLSYLLPKSIKVSSAESSLKHSTKYDPKGIQPIQGLDNIPKDIPILFIHSKEDNQIPIQGSRSLYETLKKLKYKHIHLCELDDGEHDQYTTGNAKDTYKYVLHAFYKTYGLPHNPEHARQGDHVFQRTQPDIPLS